MSREQRIRAREVRLAKRKREADKRDRFYKQPRPLSFGDDEEVIEEVFDNDINVPPKSSSFLVTVNTNKSEEALTQEYLESTLKTYSMFKADLLTSLHDALYINDNYLPKADMGLSTDDIFGINVTSGYWELCSGVNKKYRDKVPKEKWRLHLHLRVEVIYKGTSTGYFHINCDSISRHIRDKIPGIKWEGGPYINSRYIYNPADKSVVNYVNKERERDPEFSLAQRNYERYKERRDRQ